MEIGANASGEGHYRPGTIDDAIYVLKITDRWDPDASETGLIWSDALVKYKADQHPGRSIVAADGTMLRGPLCQRRQCRSRRTPSVGAQERKWLDSSSHSRLHPTFASDC